MSRFTHSICDTCWQERSPGVGADRLVEPKTERCCFCRVFHASGIYVSQDPAGLRCEGVHADVGSVPISGKEPDA